MSTIYNLINVFSNVPFFTVFYKYTNNKEKDEILKKIFSFSDLSSKRIIFVSVFPNLWRIKGTSKNVIKVSPFEFKASDLFSILLSFSFRSLVIIDAFPQIINIYSNDKDKATRSFLYFLAKLKGYTHILVFTNSSSKNDFSSQPIFNKVFYHKFYNK